MRARVVFPCLLAMLFLSGPAIAEPRRICLDDQVGLNLPARASLERELVYLLGPGEFELIWSDCGMRGEQVIRLSILPDAPKPLTNVLGLAYTGQNAIAPRLEVFVGPVMGLIQEVTCWTTVGRALARVAAHEVAHFTEQTARHEETGLLREGFTGFELASEDSQSFLLRLARR